MADDSRGTPDSGDPSIADSTIHAPHSLLLKLRQLTLFASLTDEQFKAVSDLLRIENVQRTRLFIQQGGPNTNLYIMRHGRAVVRMVDIDNQEKITRRMEVGEIFNEVAFLTGLRNAQSVEALEPLTLWYIPRDTFQALLTERRDIDENLHYPPDLPVNARGHGVKRRHHRYDWQRPNERVVLSCKKHPWVFWRTLWPILVVGALMLTVSLLARENPDPALIYIVQRSIIVLTLGLFLYALYQFIDWQNDYYVITDQRLVHRERTLLIHDQQSEVPMNKVQDVSTDRSSLLNLLLDFGDVTIDASGMRSKVHFADIPKPDRVAERIFSLTQHTRGESHASQRAKVRTDLINELKIVPEEEKQSAPPTHKHQASQWQFLQRSRQSLGGIRNTFAPRMRMVQGDNIVYRKHWLQLVEAVSLPIVCVLVYVALLILVRVYLLDVAGLLLDTSLRYGVIIVGVGLLFWAVYRYEDWRNDIYILKLDRIVDIDRSPFGLFGGTQREARFSAVQNVNLSMTGLWDNVFNIGDVIIQTAGAEGTLTFERVYDPHSVQRDIANRVETFDARIREQQFAERRHEFAEWVGIYDELKRLYGDAQKKP